MPDRHLWMRHCTQTWTFAAATTGSVTTHTVFTITGRVIVDYITAFCTSTLTSAGTPAITLGTVGSTANIIAAPTGGATDLATGDWWTVATTVNLSQQPLVATAGGNGVSQRFKLLSENIVLVIPVSTVTGGTLVFDVFYHPLTDGAKLVAPTPA